MSRLFVAKIKPAKKYAAIIKVNERFRRARIKIRVESFTNPFPIMNAIDDSERLKAFLVSEKIMRPSDRLKLKIRGAEFKEVA